MHLAFTTPLASAPWLHRLSAAGIRALEGGEASHVGIVAAGVVIDATPAGVRETPWAQWSERYALVDTIPLALPDEAAALAWLRVQMGKPYDWSAILGFALLRDWQDDRRWYCSELAAMACLVGGLRLRDRQRRIGVRLLREIAGAWSSRASSDTLV